MEVALVILALYLIWSSESNAKVIVNNQKEIAKELMKIQSAIERIAKEQSDE